MSELLIKFKYHVLCFLLFSSLFANLWQYHTIRIYEKSIVEAMLLIGIPEDELDKTPAKFHIFFLYQYLLELDYTPPEDGE